jgi:hypothetical protein
MAETPPINKPSNNAYPELNKEYCGLNAAITTIANPAIAPPIAGTKVSAIKSHPPYHHSRGDKKHK